MSKMKIKRIIPMYSIITDKFKQDFENDTLAEIKILDEQMNLINFQIKQLHTRFGLLANQSTKSAQDQINNSIIELNTRLDQMKLVKDEMMKSIDDIKNKPNGEQMETGMFENFIEIQPGDNLVELFEGPKIIIKDNIVQEIID